MGKQRKKKPQVSNRPASTNRTNWEWVARDLFAQGKISAASLEGAYGYRTDDTQTSANQFRTNNGGRP